MPREVIDARMIAGLHVQALTPAGLDHDPLQEHRLGRAGAVGALMDGAFDGDATLTELRRPGRLGLGTVQHVGGELIVIDGEA